MKRNIVLKIKNLFCNSKVTLSPFFIIFGVACYLFGSLEMFLICTFTAFFHEISHLIVARRKGYVFSQIRLMPYGAELFGELDEFKYNDEMFVALAGPLFNFAICIMCTALWWIFPVTYAYTDEICVANLMMGIFNLMPIFPLDGGRILLCFLSKKFDRKIAVKLMKKTTQIFAIIIFILFIISLLWNVNITFGFVGIMLFVSASTNKDRSSYERVIGESRRRRMLEKGIEKINIYIGEDVTLYKAYKKINYQKFCNFIVVDKNFVQKFVFDEIWLEKAVTENPRSMQIKYLYNI